MSVNERRNAKRRLRRQFWRTNESYMSRWLWRADALALPSADNPYGGLDANAIKREIRRAKKTVAPLLDEFPGFLRQVGERAMAHAAAQFGKVKRPGRRQRWPLLAFGRSPPEQIDALVPEGV